ncbi:retrovirus-related pol polyprotein from transposon TNT 1-94 [Tanacetum coccineum]
MLAPGNYVKWKSRIKRYIDTKPNHELIYYCLENPPYVYQWIPNPALETPVTDGTNEVYACPNAMEMWKAIERLKHVLTSTKTRMAENEVNERRAKRLARTANLLALVAQHQPLYQPQHNPTLYSQNSSTKSQAANKNRGKSIVTSPPPTYDPEPELVDDEASSKEKEIEKLMTLISMSFKKIYKPTNNNLRTSSNTRNTNVDNTLRSNRGTGYDRHTRYYVNQRAVNVAGARENVGTQVVQQSGIQCFNYKEFGHVARECKKPKRPRDSAYHKEKMLLCKQEEAGFQLSVQEVIPEDADNSGPIFDTKPLESDEREAEHDNIDKERVLLAYLIEKLKCEIDENKKRNKSLETSNKALQEANKEIGAVNTTLSTYIDKVQLEIARYRDMKCVKDAENDCAKEMEKELSAHQKSISTISYEKRKKRGQSVQTMIMLNRNCKMSFAKPQYLKKAQSVIPRLYDIGCYNDNLALILAPEYDEMIRLAQESRSKLNDLIKPFDYKN